MSNIKEKTLANLKKIGAYFSSRYVGFYLLIPVAVADIIFAFVYMDGFFQTEYKSVIVFVLPLLAAAAFALACFRPTARYAPAVMFALQIATLTVFVETSYMFLTTPFFNGIQGNVLVQAGFHYSFCVLSLLICIILSATAMCFRQYKNQSTFFGVPEYALKRDEETINEK